MSDINIHIYPSTFKFESRILKETKSIIDLKLASKVTIVALWENGLLEHEVIDDHRDVRRFKLFFSRFRKNLFFEFFKFFELLIRIVWFYRRSKVSYVNAHSLSVLPIGVVLKIFKRAKLVYDAHELETLRNGLYGARQKAVSIMEKALMPLVDKMIVVSPSIAKWYEQKYNLKDVQVIRNIPYSQEEIRPSDIFRKKFGLKQDDIIFIYQGLVSRGRGIELLIHTFSRVSPDKHLVIMGYGEQEELVKEAERKYSSIHFHPAVKQHEIIHYTSGADVGISLIENSCLSYYYCLPNKLFEYIMCGIPVIVSDFPDMGEVVDKYDVGWKSKTDVDSFYSIVSQLSYESLLKKKQNTEAARKDLGWEFEEKRLVTVYS